MTPVKRIPYQGLYVYEIDGEVRDSKARFQKDFIGCWNEGEISCLFFSSPHEEEVLRFVRERGRRLLSKHVMDYKDWQGGEELKPLTVGRLLITPPWEDYSVREEEILILLDPGVVFGTGTHPTTRSCLKALLELFEKGKPETVLDLGTGTGILALAAAKLGAKQVWAVDLNELAVETASRNVELNQETGRIEIRRGKAEDFIQKEADLLCANLHYQVIESLLQSPSFYEKSWYILSGLFVKDAEEIQKQVSRKGIETVLKIQEKQWLTWVGRNRPPGDGPARS
jgi:ribosomal protein L11 methyltransferase